MFGSDGDAGFGSGEGTSSSPSIPSPSTTSLLPVGWVSANSHASNHCCCVSLAADAWVVAAAPCMCCSRRSLTNRVKKWTERVSGSKTSFDLSAMQVSYLAWRLARAACNAETCLRLLHTNLTRDRVHTPGTATKKNVNKARKQR